MDLLSIKLKQETAHLHRSIEMVPALKNLMSPDLTLIQYSELLQAWYHFLHPIEYMQKNIFGLDLWFDDLSEREKTPLIEKDLRSIGADLDNNYSSELIPDCNSIEEAIGVLYVIEGSSLGAQIISKKLLKHDFINATNISFYQGYNKQTGKFWKKFITILNNWGEQNVDKHKLVIRSAQNCFSKLAEHFQKPYIEKPKLN